MNEPSMKWFKLKEVLNARHHGKHWEVRAPKPMQDESAEDYRTRSLRHSEGAKIVNGVPTVVLLGRETQIVHVGMTWQIIAMLRQSRIRARYGELPKWDWAAISQGGDVELRKLKWRARLGVSAAIFKGAGKRNTTARVAMYAAEIQEQKRAEKMAEAKRRQEEYDKQFHEQLANDEIPAAPDWQE